MFGDLLEIPRWGYWNDNASIYNYHTTKQWIFGQNNQILDLQALGLCLI